MTTKARPIATPELLLEKARSWASVFDRELNNDILRRAAEEILETHEWESGDVLKQAEFLLLMEQDPTVVVFENSATKFVRTNGTEYWQALKQVGKETMLGDFRDFIDTLIQKHGAHAKFYVDSDHGDEYFILTLKEKQ